MTTPAKTRLPLVIFAIGTVTAVAIITLALIFCNPPQCPAYTAPQNSNCVIGANIGLGLYLFLAVGIWVMGNVTALVLALRNIFLDGTRGKRSRLVRALLLVVITSAATYAVASLFLGHIHNFIRS